jgi:hypothetical protein
MKLIKGILGCALAAGLTTFVSTQAQAAVIGNQLYVPFNLKLVATYDNGSKIAKKSITSKTVLSDAGFSGKVTLAAGPSHTDNDFDIYVILNNGKNSSVLADLSTNGVLTAVTDQFASSEKGNTESSSGTVTVTYDSNFQDDFFTTHGVYSAKESEGNVNNNGQFTEKQQFNVTSLSGSGFFEELDADVVLTGSASGSSSGKIQEE